MSLIPNTNPQSKLFALCTSDEYIFTYTLPILNIVIR